MSESEIPETRRVSIIVKHNNTKLYEICREQAYFGKEITYSQFVAVIKEFNKRIIKALIKGYVFETVIGKFFIGKCKRTKPAINWNASFKRKQELIDSGQVPFEKVKHPEGVKWFIYFTDMVSYPILWKRTYSYWSFANSNIVLKQIGVSINEQKLNNEIEDYAVIQR